MIGHCLTLGPNFLIKECWIYFGRKLCVIVLKVQKAIFGGTVYLCCKNNLFIVAVNFEKNHQPSTCTSLVTERDDIHLNRFCSWRRCKSWFPKFLLKYRLSWYQTSQWHNYVLRSASIASCAMRKIFLGISWRMIRIITIDVLRNIFQLVAKNQWTPDCIFTLT